MSCFHRRVCQTEVVLIEQQAAHTTPIGSEIMRRLPNGTYEVQWCISILAD